MFGLKDLRHLDVMASLANAKAPKPREINIKALLAEDAPARDPGLNEKILSLCSKLRLGGFEKQADSLEGKFLAFKQADVHLYRVHDEDGEDLVNAAHPDGDVKVEDAEKGLGDVETIVSQHKKNVDVAQKESVGKQGMLHRYVSKCNAILRKAQLAKTPEMLASDFAQSGPIGEALWQSPFFAVNPLFAPSKWSRTTDILNLAIGSLEEKVGALKVSLVALQSDKDAQTILKPITEALTTIDSVLDNSESIKDLLSESKKNKPALETRKKTFEAFHNSLVALFKTIDARYKWVEQGALSKVYHSVVESNFAKSKIAIVQVVKELKSTIVAINAVINSPDIEEVKSVSFDDAPKATDVIKEMNDLLVVLDKKTIPPAKKEQGKAWLKGEIAKLQSPAVDAATIKQTQTDVADMKKDWSL